jgi:hypothetical protein
LLVIPAKAGIQGRGKGEEIEKMISSPLIKGDERRIL